MWGHYPRQVRHYFSKKNTKTRVQRFRCRRCGRTMSVLPRNLTPFRRFSDKALRDTLDAKLWSYAGYRKVARWPRVGGCSHSHMSSGQSTRPSGKGAGSSSPASCAA